MEAKEKARNQLLQNVNEQRIRAIIEKHVIKPILGHSQFNQMQQDVDSSIAENKAFIQSYFILYMQAEKLAETQ